MDLEELIREQHFCILFSLFYCPYLAIYQDRYDLLWIFVSVLITSLMRWKSQTSYLSIYRP